MLPLVNLVIIGARYWCQLVEGCSELLGIISASYQPEGFYFFKPGIDVEHVHVVCHDSPLSIKGGGPVAGADNRGAEEGDAMEEETGDRGDCGKNDTRS